MLLNKKNNYIFGYTINEIMLVLATISVVLVLATISYRQYINKSRDLETKNFATNLQKQIEFDLHNNLDWPNGKNFNIPEKQRKYIASAKYVRGNFNILRFVPTLSSDANVKGYIELINTDGSKLYAIALEENQNIVWLYYTNASSNPNENDGSSSSSTSSGSTSGSTSSGSTSGSTSSGSTSGSTSSGSTSGSTSSGSTSGSTSSGSTSGSTSSGSTSGSTSSGSTSGSTSSGSTSGSTSSGSTSGSTSSGSTSGSTSSGSTSGSTSSGSTSGSTSSGSTSGSTSSGSTSGSTSSGSTSGSTSSGSTSGSTSSGSTSGSTSSGSTSGSTSSGSTSGSTSSGSTSGSTSSGSSSGGIQDPENCVTGSYWNGTTCVNCTNLTGPTGTVQPCSGNADTSCTGGTTLSGNICSCPNNQYWNGTLCTTCTTNTVASCNQNGAPTACNQGYFLSGAAGVTGTTCTACPNRCQACTSSNNCTACTNGNILNNNQCVPPCPQDCKNICADFNPYYLDDNLSNFCYFCKNNYINCDYLKTCSQTCKDICTNPQYLSRFPQFCDFCQNYYIGCPKITTPQCPVGQYMLNSVCTPCEIARTGGNLAANSIVWNGSSCVSLIGSITCYQKKGDLCESYILNCSSPFTSMVSGACGKLFYNYNSAGCAANAPSGLASKCQVP